LQAYTCVQTTAGSYEFVKWTLLKEKLAERAFIVFGVYDVIAELPEFDTLKGLEDILSHIVNMSTPDGDPAILNTSTYMIMRSHQQTSSRPFGFCFLKLNPSYDEALKALESCEGVTKASLVLGENDMILEIRAKDMKEAEHIIANIYSSARENIISTTTSICVPE
jgi:hypothetical protein